MAAPALTASLTLNNGIDMPVLGLGTWNSKPGEVSEAVYQALKFGYRHIDGASAYNNETEVGQGIKRAMNEFDIKREELFIVSKLWNTKLHPDEVEPAIKKTLSDLGLDYIDLYLIHWPHPRARSDEFMPKNEDGTPAFDYSFTATDTWLAMEKLVAKNLTKSIGVSNFNSRQIKDILEKGSIVPVTNQVECQPYFNQEKLKNFCKERKITLTAYSPLGSPARPWAKPEDPNLLEDPGLLKIATAHGKSVAQVLIRWQIQRGLIVIPKSVTAKRIEENGKVFDFTLTEDELKTIASMDKGKEGRLIVIPTDEKHPEYPFNDEF